MIDRICKPIPNMQRMQIVTEYKHKFNDVHQKIETVRRLTTTAGSTNEVYSKNEEKSTKVHKPGEFKNHIKKV